MEADAMVCVPLVQSTADGVEPSTQVGPHPLQCSSVEPKLWTSCTARYGNVDKMICHPVPWSHCVIQNLFVVAYDPLLSIGFTHALLSWQHAHRDCKLYDMQSPSGKCEAVKRKMHLATLVSCELTQVHYMNSRPDQERTEFNTQPGHSPIFARGYSTVRRRCSARFLGDLPPPPPPRLTHSGAAPFSPRFILIGSQDLEPTNFPLQIWLVYDITTSAHVEVAVAERLACSPPYLGELSSMPCSVTPGNFASGNHARRCGWSTGFVGDLPFPPPLHSGAAPSSPHFTDIGSQDLSTPNPLEGRRSRIERYRRQVRPTRHKRADTCKCEHFAVITSGWHHCAHRCSHVALLRVEGAPGTGFPGCSGNKRQLVALRGGGLFPLAVSSAWFGRIPESNPLSPSPFPAKPLPLTP
ncbi:hypothetical protein PR048_019679 [Dryococelus australis]|uniref:Uncharacterized protein n=1 Tax=Dryococelus australis TaxID=614101 RepID=A0ABQ9H460_9NEOP|nr:hypothetical protein PR048_019679 [Dryococelus australis]